MISRQEVIMKKEAKKSRLAWSPESQSVYTHRTIEKARAGNRPTLRAFADWLAKSRGLGPGSITIRLGSACSFVEAVTVRAGVTCVRAFRSLTADGIEDFW